MNGQSPVSIRRGIAVLVALALLLTGAGITYLLVRTGADSGDRDTPAGRERGPASDTSEANATAGSTVADNAPLPDVTVTLTEEGVERAGIVVTPVSSGTAAAAVRMPGVVEPNAYRRVEVTPIVGGRVTRVLVQLGDRVRRGQMMAEVYSPELAEAQT
jgi:multidrug efflux pump subunit AcrA (membrane-fusion protein)